MLAILAALIVAQPPALPTIRVSSDDTKLDHSCRIAIAPGAVIADANGDGVLHITADDLTVEFADGAVLAGSAASDAPDTFKGIGLRLDGHKNITIKNARISGFKVGVRATDCPGLTVDTADLSGNYRQHLKSTPQAEDGSDWLFPHNNDGDEWTVNHGAGLSVKNAAKVTLRNIRIRAGQNGIVLDRVTDSAIYDNDCSFLSGWGLAMWRSSGNVITRNALDFCVRGYSHGVYNRGQDSAGLLMFEQNCNNTIAENSITHGGDGIFGFAGREAIGEAPAPPTADGKPFNYKRVGNSDNLIIANDLSYAPAHGLEMTFSAGNRVFKNRFVQNAICGIWGGYSNDTIIVENAFEGNGEMAYGLERGGINIEHGSGNLITANTFKDNKCGIHLWWNNNPGLLKLPGAAANERGVTGNIISDNTFTGDLLALQLRDDPKAPEAPHVRGTVFSNNKISGVAKERDVATGIAVAETGSSPIYAIPQYTALGSTHPVGARKELAGRQNIIMTEWGPWDHATPLARLISTRDGVHTYEFNGVDPANVAITGLDAARTSGSKTKPWTAAISSNKPGSHSYSVAISQADYRADFRGSILTTRWALTVFPWEGPTGPNPPPDLAKWRAAAAGPTAIHATVGELRYAFGGRGPSQMDISPEITNAKFDADHFGIIATTSLALTPGKWRISTTSDDGIRVIADGKTVLENWTHHGAATDSGEFEATAGKPVEVTVEYFEIFGSAVLEVKVEPVEP